MFARLDSQIPGTRFICRFFLLVAVVVGAGCIAQATTFTVNKTADTNDGFCNADCSLREAMVAANNSPGADLITFNTGTVFTPTTPLPAITDSLTIDGGTVNGYPDHEISGTLAGANADGLVVSSPVVVAKITVIIKNLAIYRFGRHGIFVNSFSGVNFTLLNCALGTDAVGMADQGNGQNGLRIFAYANSTFNVGSTTPADKNVISGNNSDGIAIVTASNISNANTQISIINNNIGTNDIGSAKLGNAGNGISFTGASTGYQLTIGGPPSTSRNLISGNGQNGIYAASNKLLLYGNYIGPGFNGDNGLGNSLDGIRLDGNVDATIGGTLNGNGPAFDGGNVISGNGGDGVNIINHNATVTIKRNLIGINAWPIGRSGQCRIWCRDQGPQLLCHRERLDRLEGQCIRFQCHLRQRELRNIRRRESWQAFKFTETGSGLAAIWPPTFLIWVASGFCRPRIRWERPATAQPRTSLGAIPRMAFCLPDPARPPTRSIGTTSARTQTIRIRAIRLTAS
jgi:CSLREA domain-containing protein